MQFLAPEWLVLVPLLGVAAWLWPHLGLTRPFRLAILVLLVLLLVRPAISGVEDGMDVWMLVDRSKSAEQSVGPHVSEWRTLLERSRSSDDRLHIVDFATETQPAGATGFEGDAERTNLNDAVRYVLSRINPSRASRVLALTDGYSSQPLQGLAERLLRQNVPLDIRLAVVPDSADFKVDRLDVPTRVEAEEAFVLSVQASGSKDIAVPFVIYRNDREVLRGKLPFTAGKASLQFSDRLDLASSYRYRVELLPADDNFPGNNSATAWVEAAGVPRIMVISASQQDPVAASLTQVGFPVELVTNPLQLTVGSLSGIRCVILNNVAAHHIPQDFLKGLDFFVRTQGGGLMMLGGRDSFGSGGYFRSAIDELLPVSMELRAEHQRFATAVAIVLDRSGSMSIAVPGSPGLTKIQMAADSAAEAINLLGPKDEVAVFAVDSAAHLVVPRMSVQKNRTSITNTVRSINSEGGGIYVYEGLNAAWNEIKDSPLKQKHILLFSDAADSEEPGDYKKLIEEIRKAHATVSVIAMGTVKDPDAELLFDIAERGQGRIFYTDNPADLPALFIQDTASFARSVFVDGAAKVVSTGSWRELTANEIKWPDEVGGYNLTYQRKEASTLALTGDEYHAPLLAFFRKGAGQTAAVTFPVSGPHAGLTSSWAQFPQVMQTLTRFLAGSESGSGISLDTHLESDTLVVSLHYSDEWEEKVTAHPPQAYLGDTSGSEPKSIPWVRSKPGLFVARIPLTPGISVRGAVQVGSAVLPFGPAELSIHPEYDFDPQRITEIKTVSRLSGGQLRTDLTSIWSAVPEGVSREITIELLILLFVLFLLDALLTRLGMQPNFVSLPKFATAENPGVPAKSVRKTGGRIAMKPGKTAPTPPSAGPDIPSVPPDPEPLSGGDGAKRSKLFERAKRRGA